MVRAQTAQLGMETRNILADAVARTRLMHDAKDHVATFH